jgi:hypothetical protein
MFFVSWAFKAVKEIAIKTMSSILFINSNVLSTTKIIPRG